MPPVDAEPSRCLPPDLGSIARHTDPADGRLNYLGARFVQRLADERRIPSYRIGGKLLISASDVEALIITRPALTAGCS